LILEINRKHLTPEIEVLEMAGRIVLGSDGMQVEWTVAQLLKADHKKLIFDLSRVTLLDSTGVGVLVMCHAKVKKAGGVLRIAGVTGMVEDTLKLTSVDKLIGSFPTVDEAAQAM
jgi:anti-sigma B factor antagonist